MKTVLELIRSTKVNTPKAVINYMTFSPKFPENKSGMTELNLVLKSKLVRLNRCHVKTKYTPEIESALW